MVPELGIIEGYFGRAWTWAQRAAVVDCLAPAGYRFFHYAPKADDRLRRQWRTLHDDAAIDAMAAFAGHARGQSMRFGIGLTPYGLQGDVTAADRAALVAKIRHLDRAGIDDLAILFDDMRGDMPGLAARQADVMALAADTTQATRLFLCPSYYSDDPLLDRVFGARPANYLADLGRALDPAINIYWTGEEVCARAISTGHVDAVADRIGRPVSLWDNYPVNDGPRMANHLHLRSFTGRSARLGHRVRHHAINPASQPMLGCIPALTLPMLYADGAQYRYGAAFLAAATRVCGEGLAAMLQADLLSLEDGGLGAMSADRRAALRARYAGIDHPAARELVDWLDGGYAITGEMLQTQ